MQGAAAGEPGDRLVKTYQVRAVISKQLLRPLPCMAGAGVPVHETRGFVQGTQSSLPPAGFSHTHLQGEEVGTSDPDYETPMLQEIEVRGDAPPASLLRMSPASFPFATAGLPADAYLPPCHALSHLPAPFPPRSCMWRLM